MGIERIKELKKRIIGNLFFGQAVSFVLNNICDVSSKKIVEAGCGNGEMSIFFALQGAQVVGIDMRNHSLKRAKKFALEWNVQDKCIFLRGITEAMPIDTGSIDIVFSKSTIQYMNRKDALNEYKRILKLTGILVLIENLPFNPFINIYRLHRKLFARTEKEINYVKSIRGYLTFREINNLKNDFYKVNHREFHFFCMFTIFLCLYKNYGEKYWIVKKMNKLMIQLDNLLFYCFPFMKRLAWFTAVFCQGQKDKKCLKNKEEV